MFIQPQQQVIPEHSEVAPDKVTTPSSEPLIDDEYCDNEAFSNSPESLFCDDDHDSVLTAPEYSPVVSMSSLESTSTMSPDEAVDIPQVVQQSSCTMPTFKLVGDNIDKTVKPRQMRVDSQAQSLHYFHTYAVKDRFDFSSFDDQPSLPSLEDIDVSSLLPSESDIKEMKGLFAIHVARVLKKHTAFFSTFGKGLECHIAHEYSAQMATKLEVVGSYF